MVDFALSWETNVCDIEWPSAVCVQSDAGILCEAQEIETQTLPLLTLELQWSLVWHLQHKNMKHPVCWYWHQHHGCSLWPYTMPNNLYILFNSSDTTIKEEDKPGIKRKHSEHELNHEFIPNTKKGGKKQAINKACYKPHLSEMRTKLLMLWGNNFFSLHVPVFYSFRQPINSACFLRNSKKCRY